MSDATTVVIHSAELITGGSRTNDAWVRFDGNQVAAVGQGGDWRRDLPPRAAVTDARGLLLVPGFIDIHCHGGGGSSVEEGADAIRQVLRTHRAHGTTRTMLSLVSAPLHELSRTIRQMTAVAEEDPAVLGLHLEGPFLDHDFRGAHDPGSLIAPRPAVVDELLDASAGTLRVLTLAPEAPGGIAAIKRLVAADVSVAIGHTACDFELAQRAFDAGATLLTHAFNGMRGIHHRAPGPVVAAMRTAGVTLEIIADGVHVDPAIIRLAFEGAPERVALITDAMAAAGGRDGMYRLGQLDVIVAHGIARLADGRSIAGSTLTHDAALRRAVYECGVPLAQAVRALTCVPAHAIARGHDLGYLSPGYAADAVLLDAHLSVAAVWANGEQVVPKSER